MGDQPQFVRQLFGQISGRARADTAWALTCGAVRAIDDMVGASLDSLLLIRGGRPLLACYVSDNGYMWGEHWIREGKWSAFEEASRVPFLCAGFNGLHVVAQDDSSSLVQMIDLTATFLDYANATASHQLSGRSLRPILETGNAPLDWRVNLLLEQYRPYAHNQNYSCIRNMRFKFCAYEQAETTLYDLWYDPHETQNVVHTLSYRSTVARLGQRLDSLKQLP